MNKALKMAWSRRIVRVTVMAASCALSISAQIAPDSGMASPEESVKLSARGAFQVERAAVGDTVEYRLIVEWRDSRIPVMVLAPDTLETPGFRVVGQSAVHRKTADNSEIRNVTEFTYKLMARTPGGAKVSALKLRYLTGFSNREEALYVPGAFIEIDPARVPLWKRLWFQILLGIALLAGIIWGGWRASRSLSLSKGRLRDRDGRPSKQRDFAPLVRALKGRWNTADSRVWIEDAEKVCLEFLRYNLGAETPGTARFESLLDQYLARHPNPAEAEGWNKLRDLFHHARYAGGRKEPHELQETYRILKTCLHIPGENE